MSMSKIIPLLKVSCDYKVELSIELRIIFHQLSWILQETDQMQSQSSKILSAVTICEGAQGGSPRNLLHWSWFSNVMFKLL